MLTMRENSLLWIGSRACSHKNGILDWVVFFFLLTLKKERILSHDKIAFGVVYFIQMCSVLQQNLHLFLVSFLLFYGKKVGKKPTTNEKLQFALTHTPAPQSCQIEISRHSWTPPHSLRYTTNFSLY
jgi:hypothetical protein